MSINCFLAMTAAEFASAAPHPHHAAWMACHFELYGCGLEGLPQALPPGSMVIVNDRIPPHRHDPLRIATQLEALEKELSPSGFLLDFQQKNCPETAQIAKCLVHTLSAPVGVSEAYAEDLDCPVFLAPPPLYIPLCEGLERWTGREIWLEAALESGVLQFSAGGSTYTRKAYKPPKAPHFPGDALFCRYRVQLNDNGADFTFYRGETELKQFLRHAELLGVTRSVGLYQQLHSTYNTAPEA